MQINAIVQARLSSTRLPGKVFKKIGDRSVIEQVFYQLSFSKKISKIILATSSDNSDDPLFEWANSKSIDCFRGSLSDVLDRFYHAAKKFDSDVIIRITADCPLIDPEIVDRVIDLFLSDKYDYTSNINPPTFPDGLDVEVFSFNALREAWEDAKLLSEREHVTPYIRNHPEKFKIGNFENQTDLQMHRWTLDNEDDYVLLTRMFEKIKNSNGYIKLDDVLDVLEKDKNLIEINKHIMRNEGYTKSITNDEEIK